IGRHSGIRPCGPRRGLEGKTLERRESRGEPGRPTDRTCETRSGSEGPYIRARKARGGVGQDYANTGEAPAGYQPGREGAREVQGPRRARNPSFRLEAGGL